MSNPLHDDACEPDTMYLQIDGLVFVIEANQLHEGVDPDSDWDADSTTQNVPLDDERIVDYWLGVYTIGDRASFSSDSDRWRALGYYTTIHDAVMFAYEWNKIQKAKEQDSE
jgi:hypothetical protein